MFTVKLILLKNVGILLNVYKLMNIFFIKAMRFSKHLSEGTN